VRRQTETPTPAAATTRKDDERLAKPLEIGGDDRFSAPPGHEGHGPVSGGLARRVGA
jgi:hypothetical protein